MNSRHFRQLEAAYERRKEWEYNQRLEEEARYHEEPEYNFETSGYTFDPSDRTWHKRISAKIRTARRHHKDGRVLKGQRYLETVDRYINDDGSGSWLARRRQVIP